MVARTVRERKIVKLTTFVEVVVFEDVGVFEVRGPKGGILGVGTCDGERVTWGVEVEAAGRWDRLVTRSVEEFLVGDGDETRDDGEDPGDVWERIPRRVRAWKFEEGTVVPGWVVEAMETPRNEPWAIYRDDETGNWWIRNDDPSTGRSLLNPGDYIVRKRGGLYPVDPEVFETGYRKVKEKE